MYKLRCEIAPFCPHFAPLYRPNSFSVPTFFAPAALICRLSPPAVPSKLYILSLFAPVGVRKYGENTLGYLHFVAFGRFGISPPCVLGRRPGYPLQNSRYSKPPKFATIPTTEIRGSNSSEEGIMEEVGESGRGVEMFGCCGEFVFASFVGQSEGHGGG